MSAGDTYYGSKMATGQVAGTGALINVIINFKPLAILVINRTTNSFANWCTPMGDAAAQKVVDSGAGTTDVSFITTNGITVGSQGFSIGTDASLNNASDIIYWVAYGR